MEWRLPPGPGCVLGRSWTSLFQAVSATGDSEKGRMLSLGPLVQLVQPALGGGMGRAVLLLRSHLSSVFSRAVALGQGKGVPEISEKAKRPGELNQTSLSWGKLNL